MASSSGPPYQLDTASMGGLPLIIPDIPISAVLLALFVISAATHMTIFQLNRRRSHKFIFSGLLFGHSMARIAALTMRIVWATRSDNIHIAIAANILTQAGVVVIFVVNLFFAQRIVRSYCPKFGWSLPATWAVRFLVVSVILCLLMVIICTVQEVYTLDTNARRIDRDVQLFSGTFLTVLAFLPIPIVVATLLLPRPEGHKLDRFGSGRMRSKVGVLLLTSLLLTLGAGWRVGTNYVAPPAGHSKWFDHKAAYYVLDFGIELIVTYTYALARFDRRFHVPNKVKGQTGYNGPRLTTQVQTEEEVFGTDTERDSGADTIRGSGKDVRENEEDDAEKGESASIGLHTAPSG